MSELLLHWLNHELQLSTRVTAVERDFASGYLLGELLQRLNQQHNLSDFMDSAIADAKIINFCLLEPTLRRMGVRFDARAATDIMNGRAGAAADLLYQIKMAADRMARAPRVSTKSDATDVLALHNMPPKLAKPSYDAAHHYFFEHSVRRQVKSLAALQKERDAVARETQRMRAYRAQQAQLAAQLEATKAERLHQAFIHSAFIKTALDETDSPAWRRALETKRSRERRQAQFQRQLAAERAHKADAHAFSLKRTVETDLDEFERRKPSGAMSPTKGTARKSHGYGLRSLSTTLERQATLRGPGLRDPNQPIALAETGASTAEQLEEAGAIREQQQLRARRREQLGRRRKRFLQDALHAQSHANAARAAGELELLVGRATHREAEATQAVAKILVYKEIAAENRLRRDESYAARREMDAHEAIDRDAAAFELLFAQYNDDWALQGAHAHARRTARAAAQQHENALVAALALHELLALAMAAAAKREDAMHARDASDSAFLASDESWAELRLQFAARGVEGLEASKETTNEAEDALLRHQLDQYLARFWTPAFPGALAYVGAVTKGSRVSPWVPGDWKFVAAEEILEDRFVLGETVKHLRWLTRAAPTTAAVAAAESPRIAQEAEANSSPTVGTELALVPQEDDQAALAEPHPGANGPEDAPEVASGEAVLDALRVAEPEESPSNQNGGAPAWPPSQEDNNRVQAADDADPPLPRLRVVLLGPPFAGRATQATRLAEKFDLALLSVEQLLADALAQRSALGQRALDVLSAGGELPPRVYSELVVDAIARLNARHRDRWVLFDLPPTAAHAQSLEEQLSGFVEPARVASPFDLESPLAPGCPKPRLPASFLHGKSGVDLAFYLACAEETVLERCLGALEDRETRERGRVHLLLAPPPADATDRHRLQHVNATTNASALLSLQCLTVADRADATAAWYERFATLHAVATTERHEGQSVATTRALTQEATHARLVAEIDAFVEMQRERDDAKARDRELDEANAMAREETRQRALAARKQAIQLAQDEVARAQLAVQQAEEAKAKKEELAELRGGVDAARKQLELALVDARDWKVEEALRGRRAHATFSAKLLPPLARVLAATWDALEREYSHAMTRWLRLQRQQRARVEQRVQWLVGAVCRVLRRADARQRLVDAFQAQFNAVEEAMRFEDATKRELHARADVLQDALCELSATKRRGSEDVLREMMGDGWQEHACQWLALAGQRALQAECDRFRGALQLLADAFLAASDEPALLAGAADALTSGAGASLLGELTLKVFVDASEEQAAQVAAAAAAAAAAATPAPAANAKGGKAAPKGKPPLASVASVHAGGLGEGALAADPLAVDTLLLAYDLVVQKSEAIVELVMNAPPKHEDAAVPEPPAPVAPVAAAPAAGAHGKTKTGATPVATPTATPVSSVALLPRQSVDVATSNFHKAVRYEQELLARRVAHLKDATQSACERVARTLRAAEATLCDAIAQRAAREDAAVASLVAHVRAAIERETDLPFYINVQPEHVYRFPITAHLLEDTSVVVDARHRLVARAPEDPPPRIEPRDAVVLSARQASELRRRLQLSPEKSEEHEDEEPTMTVIEVVAVLLALANEPHALPSEWHRADEAALVEVVAAFADAVSELVDARALVDAMAAGATLLEAIRSREPPPSTDATDAADAPLEDHGDVSMEDSHEDALSEC